LVFIYNSDPKFLYHNINQHDVLLQKAAAHVTEGFPFDVTFYCYGLEFDHTLMQRAKRIRAIHKSYRHHVEEHDRNVERLLFL